MSPPFLERLRERLLRGGPERRRRALIGWSVALVASALVVYAAVEVNLAVEDPCGDGDGPRSGDDDACRWSAVGGSLLNITYLGGIATAWVSAWMVPTLALQRYRERRDHREHAPTLHALRDWYAQGLVSAATFDAMEARLDGLRRGSEPATARAMAGRALLTLGLTACLASVVALFVGPMMFVPEYHCDPVFVDSTAGCGAWRAFGAAFQTLSAVGVVCFGALAVLGSLAAVDGGRKRRAILEELDARHRDAMEEARAASLARA